MVAHIIGYACIGVIAVCGLGAILLGRAIVHDLEDMADDED